MNEKANEQMDALMGAGGKTAETTDWEQKCGRLEEVLAAQNGRVKERDARVKELEKELEELRNSKKSADLKSSLSEEERNSIPEEVLDAAAKLVSSGMSRVQAENEERWNRETQRRSAMAKEEFVARVNSRYPGFMSSVSAGGDKADKWQDYVRYNKASISEAYANFDFNTIAYHIEQFYSNFLGVRVPSGVQDGSAAPDPRTSGGGNTAHASNAPGRTYTSAEFLGLYDQIEAARNKGDWAEKKRLEAELKNAPAEGRVKD